MPKIISGFLYFIGEMDTTKVKIGVTSKTVIERIKELNTGNSGELIEIATFRTIDMYMAEKVVHEQLSEYRYKGEWFNLSPEILRYVLNDLRSRYDIVLSKNGYKVIADKYLVLESIILPDGITVHVEKCPFCGDLHKHGNGDQQIEYVEGVPTLGHRVRHCAKGNIEIELPNGIVVTNNYGYYLGIGDFLDSKT